MVTVKPSTTDNDPRTVRITHLIWLVLVLAPLMAATVLTFVPDRSGGSLSCFGVALPAQCISRTWFGVFCPTCGISRAMTLFAHGRWGEAFRMHPAGPLLYAALVAEALYHLTRSLRPAWQAPPWLDRFRIGVFAGLLALCIVRWFVRLTAA